MERRQSAYTIVPIGRRPGRHHLRLNSILKELNDDSVAVLQYEGNYCQYDWAAISANPDGYGTVSASEITADYGSPIEFYGRTVSIGGEYVSAKPADADAQYTYEFESWTVNGDLTGDTSLVANFTRAVNEYTVTVTKSGASYGTVSKSSFTVPYGTAVSADGNVLTVGQEQCVAEAKAPTAKYVYSFKGWTIPSDTVAGDMTVKASFARSIAYHTVTFKASPDGYGSVVGDSLSARYGTAIEIDGSNLRIGDGIAVAVPAESDAQYTYS